MSINHVPSTSMREGESDLVTLADEETWGSDFVLICRRIAKSALLLECSVLPEPINLEDEGEFGSELAELMRRAVREAHEKRFSIDWRALRTTITDEYHPNVIDYLWRVAYDEMRLLGLSVPPQVLQTTSRKGFPVVTKSAFSRGQLIQIRAHAKETFRSMHLEAYRKMQLGLPIPKQTSTTPDKPPKK